MNRYGKRCVLYPRVSTEMQVDGYSLEGQKNMLTRFADREEMIVVDTYEDAGKSGKSIEGRPAFQKMLRDIEDGLDIDYILVYTLSRFGRNAADILNSLELVQSYGVNLICIEEGIDSSQTSGKLLISVLSAVAEIERENIIEQTMNGRREKARQGGWNGSSATKEALDAFGYGTSSPDPRFELTYYAGKVEGPNGTIKLDDGTDLEYVPSEITLDLSGKASEKTAGARMKKYELDASATNDGKLQSNDIVLFRYADVLLMKSEAKVRNGGNGDAELTEVRERAGATLDVTATLETLLEERLREFAWEGLRRQDLVRFGKFTRAYTDRPQLPKEDTGYTTVFPIHEDVLSLNGKLTQNYGY